jgi:transposase-like protein
VIAELKQERRLGRRCRCRTCPYLNNIVEQDHRAIKRRVNASQGFRSFDGAWRTIQGYEILHMIRKGQVRWLPKGDVRGQIQFVRIWCKQAQPGDDGRMQRFVPIEVLFKGRHFDGQIIILCVSWYTSFKLSKGLGDPDG